MAGDASAMWAAVATAGAAAAWVRDDGVAVRRRLRRVCALRRPGDLGRGRRRLALRGSTRSTRVASAGRSRPTPSRLAAAVAAVATAVVVGGWFGLVLGAVVGAATVRLLARLTPKAMRERARLLRSQAPEVADLLAACLASGAPVPVAVDAVAGAMGEPVSEPLRVLVASLDLGADPVETWRALAAQPGLETLGRAVARSVDSGAPLADVLPGIADDLRRETRTAVEAAARAAGVRAVAPLGACFLPAFLLLGVVPVVASLAGDLLG